MDYQTFNSPQHMPPAFGGGLSSSAPTHSHSPQQQQQLYADPQARLQQSTPSFPYTQQQQPQQQQQQQPQAQFANSTINGNGQQGGGFPSTMPGPALTSNGGAMMQLGGLSQSQLHQARGKPASKPNRSHRSHRSHRRPPSALHRPIEHRPPLSSAPQLTPAMYCSILDRAFCAGPAVTRPLAVPPRPLAVGGEQ
jgi:hypothetical protein